MIKFFIQCTSIFSQINPLSSKVIQHLFKTLKSRQNIYKMTAQSLLLAFRIFRTVTRNFVFVCAPNRQMMFFNWLRQFPFSTSPHDFRQAESCHWDEGASTACQAGCFQEMEYSVYHIQCLKQTAKPNGCQSDSGSYHEKYRFISCCNIATSKLIFGILWV